MLNSLCHIQTPMRAGRYKKNFITPEQCAGFAHAMLPLANQLQRHWINHSISAPDLVARYLLAGIQYLRPHSWKGSRLKPGTPLTALETVEIFSFRGIPLSAQRALSQWARGQYPLRLFLDVPSTEEVLTLQNQGIRCVTVVLDPEMMSRYVLGERDPLSFTLHDLIHADHFFCDSRQTCVQIGFSRWLSEMWKEPSLREVLARSSAFAAQFEYACADMNSHGAHLVKYLKAIFCQNDCQDLLHSLAASCRLSAGFLEALKVLNTPAENAAHLQILETEFLALGSHHNILLSEQPLGLESNLEFIS
jgi:hypothetical protein